MPLHGSHYILSVAPWWAVAGALYVATILVLWPMRLYFEGVAYNVAWSSKYGDIVLIAIVEIAQALLQYNLVQMPGWATGWVFHLVCACVAVAVGTFLVLGPTPLWRSQITDNYHNFFVVGLYVYLLLSIAPVLWYAQGYSAIAAALALLAVWALLAFDDVRTGRMDQRAYLMKQGVTFKN